MPEKAARKRAAAKKAPRITKETEDLRLESSIPPEFEEPAKPPHSKKFFFLGLLVIALVVILYLGKGIFLVALVNGRPITRWDLDRQLEKGYGQQLLDNLISESLVSQEISKQKIKVTSQDIDKEIEKLKQTLPPNTTLEEALKSNGMTMEQLKNEAKKKIEIERIIEQKISPVTDKEVEDFIAQNASQLSSTASAKQKEEAEEALRQRKLGQAFNTWITDLKSKSSILKFSL